MISNKIAKNLLDNSFIFKILFPYRYKELMAFTLAEVLITLLTIGIVASLVIPALITDTNDAEYKTALKKTAADLNQAFTQIRMQDSNGSVKGLFTSNSDIRDGFTKYLSITKQCDDSETIGNCWTVFQRYMNNTPITAGTSSGAILNNGVSLRFRYSSGNCTNVSMTSAGYPICGWIYADINGYRKGPNIWGKDLFGFWIMENRLMPMGFQGDSYVENDCSIYGVGCAAVYLAQ